jgi:alkanesulfonate monooxygenase SsuD/methylene tetrahydromethanopterin reductase-like flavin-dependent oxidoreductase (luciferase family)
VTIQLGAHIGQQNMSSDEMRDLWRWLDEVGLDWISVWDHLYEAPPAGGTKPHFEAVATLGALAVDTTQARLGCLVFYVGYRNPGLLARAAVTLDHLSGGRFELGLGGGWHQWEAEAFGYEFPSVGTRLDMLDEATELIAQLLRQGSGDGRPDGTGVAEAKAGQADESIARTNYAGRHYRASNASMLPPPVGGRLPIWVGGRGEKRTLRTAARLADGWNAAYISAEEFGRLGGVLDHWCEEEGRDPASIERSVNLAFALGTDAAAAETARSDFDTDWGPMADRVRHGTLFGTVDGAAEQILAYAEAGADLVNVALRAPFDREALEAYVTDVVPAIRAAL